MYVFLLIDQPGMLTICVSYLCFLKQCCRANNVGNGWFKRTANFVLMGMWISCFLTWFFWPYWPPTGFSKFCLQDVIWLQQGLGSSWKNTTYLRYEILMSVDGDTRENKPTHASTEKACLDVFLCHSP